MKIEITHTITLAPEVLTLLQGFLGKAQTPTAAPLGSTVSPKAETKAVAKAQDPKEASPVKETITLERVREVVQTKAVAGKRTEVKAILTAFGAENVTGLSQEKYAEFIEKVNDL